MKRTLVALLLVASSGAAANAVQVTSVITDSVQLTVEGAAAQTQRIGSTYSVSGTNITAGTLGGLTGASATAAATVSAGSYEVTNDGQAFTFSESTTVGDTPITAQTTANTDGRFDSPALYGDSTTSIGGTAGALAGTLQSNSPPTITAGGPGTTGIGQRTVELTVFR